MPQDDQDAFGEWLAQEATRLAPTITNAASEFASEVFLATAFALRDGNVENTLDGQLEQLRLQFTEACQEFQIDEPEAQAFMATIETLAENGIGTSNPPEYYQIQIERAIAELQKVTKTAPVPAESHVPVPVRRRPRRLRLLKEGKPEGIEAIVKVDQTLEDQHLVTGWVSIIEDPYGRPIEDAQGDVISEADLVEAAHRFMKESREAGDSHARVTGIGTVVDSIVFTKDLKEKLGSTSLPTGWLITIKVDDADTWRRVKSGELAAFSIGGTGVRESLPL